MSQEDYIMLYFWTLSIFTNRLIQWSNRQFWPRYNSSSDYTVHIAVYLWL